MAGLGRKQFIDDDPLRTEVAELIRDFRTHLRTCEACRQKGKFEWDLPGGLLPRYNWDIGVYFNPASSADSFGLHILSSGKICCVSALRDADQRRYGVHNVPAQYLPVIREGLQGYLGHNDQHR